MKSLPSIDRLHELFALDGGVLVRKVTRCASARAGDRITGTNGLGYVQVMVDRQPMTAHRIVWAMVHGSWPNGHIDHINGDTADNRPENLREATHAENLQNRGLPRNNTLGVKGVGVTANGKYVARVRAFNKTHHIGTFSSLAEAAKAYEEAAKRVFGEFHCPQAIT